MNIYNWQNIHSLPFWVKGSAPENNLQFCLCMWPVFIMCWLTKRNFSTTVFQCLELAWSSCSAGVWMLPFCSVVYSHENKTVVVVSITLAISLLNKCWVTALHAKKKKKKQFIWWKLSPSFTSKYSYGSPKFSVHWNMFKKVSKL